MGRKKGEEKMTEYQRGIRNEKTEKRVKKQENWIEDKKYSRKGDTYRGKRNRTREEKMKQEWRRKIKTRPTADTRPNNKGRMLLQNYYESSQ